VDLAAHAVRNRFEMRNRLTVPVTAVGAFGCVAALAALSGCGGAANSASSGEDPTPSARPDRSQPTITARAPCEVGEKPRYFVPGQSTFPVALLGCARLGVSGKRVEFSANFGRIGRHRHLCINPAYSGRGRYIPAVCALSPPPQEFSVVDASQPRQAVRHYRLVVWGTAPESTTGVLARFRKGLARAALLRVGPRLARRFGERPFSIFVFELPLRAACGPLLVTAQGHEATERVGARPMLCSTSHDV
jgi:hypothetical protein